MRAFRNAGMIVGGLMTVGLALPSMYEHEVGSRSTDASKGVADTAGASSLGPVVGACCFDWNCCEMGENECIDANGTFHEGRACDAGNPCQYGACCLPGGALPGSACANGLRADCDEYCGIFMGPETDCDPDPCEYGACCYDGVDGGECRNLRPDYCTDFLGGSFQGLSTTCADLVCTGACCVSSGSCVENVTDRTCIEYLRGAFLGTNATCAANAVCKDTVGACCIPDHRRFGALAVIPENWPGTPLSPCIITPATPPPSQQVSGTLCPTDKQALCLEVTEFECSAYGDFGAVYRGDGSTCSASDCALIGPTIVMREPWVKDGDVHTGASGVVSVHILWSERLMFGASDLKVTKVTKEGTQSIPFSVSGSHTQRMNIAFGEVLLNDRYTITISDSVVSAVTRNPIDGDNDGIAGGDAVLFMEHRNPFDRDRDADVDLDDFRVMQRCFSGPHNPANPGCLP